MNADDAIHEGRDILCNRPVASALFLLPILALIAAGALDIGNGWRTAVWAAAFSTMGIGCIVNALRCGRVHCYLTGPFFLALAALIVLYGLGIVRLGTYGWSTITLIALAGGVFLCCVPELLFGRYRQTPQ